MDHAAAAATGQRQESKSAGTARSDAPMGVPEISAAADRRHEQLVAPACAAVLRSPAARIVARNRMIDSPKIEIADME